MFCHDYNKDWSKTGFIQEKYDDDVELTCLPGDEILEKPRYFKRHGHPDDFGGHFNETLAKCPYCGHKGWTYLQTNISFC